MLIHTVLLAPRTPDDEARIREACAILSCLDIPGMTGFRHGPNRDFEGKSARYTYGFVVTFADRAAQLVYAAHPDHLRAGAMLVESCHCGHDGIFVSDLEA